MCNLQFINNQYDNKLKCLPWNKQTIKKFIYVIKHPIIIAEKDKIPQWKFCDVIGDDRKTENMGMTDVIILDFDNNDYTIKEFEKDFDKYYYILHTSHSYDGIKQKFRVFLFLDQKYDIQRLFFKCSNKAFSSYHILLKYFSKVDPASFVKCQFFKMPAIKEKNAPYYYKFNNGKKFNPFVDIGFEVKMAYEYGPEKQEEYLRQKEKEYEKFRKKYGMADLSKAKEYIEEKIESAPDGGRHNVIFGLATWWKHIGGMYADFASILPSWADRSFHKQLEHLRLEWDRLK